MFPLMLHALLPLRALRLGLGGSHLVTGSRCQSDPTADKSDGWHCKLRSPEVHFLMLVPMVKTAFKGRLCSFQPLGMLYTY